MRVRFSLWKQHSITLMIISPQWCQNFGSVKTQTHSWYNKHWKLRIECLKQKFIGRNQRKSNSNPIKLQKCYCVWKQFLTDLKCHMLETLQLLKIYGLVVNSGNKILCYDSVIAKWNINLDLIFCTDAGFVFKIVDIFDSTVLSDIRS